MTTSSKSKLLKTLILAVNRIKDLSTTPKNLRQNRLFIYAATCIYFTILPTAKAQILDAEAELLPKPITDALINAGVNLDNVSIVISPINSLSSDALNKDESSNYNIKQQHSKLINYIAENNQPQLFEPHTASLKNTINYLADTPRIPASTMKLIPTFIALDVLGPDFKWINQVYRSGIIKDATLYGDLIIKGSGDPKLTHENLELMLLKVKMAGIKHIVGNIVLDSSVFYNVEKDPASFNNDPLRPYNTSPSGLLINFNSIQVIATPQQNHVENNHKSISNNPNSVLLKKNLAHYPTINSYAKLNYIPQLADYNLPEFIAVKTGACNVVRSAVAPVWQAKSLTFNNPLPSGCFKNHEDASFYIAHPDIKEFATKVVKQKWAKIGGSLSGDVYHYQQLSPKNLKLNMPSIHTGPSNLPFKALDKSQTLNPADKITTPYQTSNLALIATFASGSLSQQIHDINHFSNNVMTEQLLLSLPLYVTTNVKPPNMRYFHSNYTTYPMALNMVDNWWQTNLTSSPPNMSNGSGLCVDCQLTATNLAELLTYAYYHPHFNHYLNSLGVAGVSGTIKGHSRRLPKSVAIGRAWIKTGTLNNVSAIAGYVSGLSGQDFVVVVIVNGDDDLNHHHTRYALDAIMDWTAKN